MPHNYVGSLFGHDPDTRDGSIDEGLVSSDVYLGIELELEDVRWLEYQRRFLTDNNWQWDHDASLRGYSCELISGVMGKPIKGFDVMVALEALDQAIAKTATVGHLPNLSDRTSTHIHIDVSDLSPSQLANFLLYYAMFEHTIMRAEAPMRCDNNYCLQIGASKDLKDSLAKLVEADFAERTLHDVVRRWPKYSAVNLNALAVLGTVEFRMFPGCYNGKDILRWINMLLSLRRAAVKGTFDPLSIPEVISGHGYTSILDQVFPEEIAEHLKGYVEPRDMLRGARLVQSILLQRYANKRGFKATALPEEPSNQFNLYKEGVA